MREENSVLIGAHMSTAGGVGSSIKRAQSIGISTMQIFTKNQNRWQQKPTPPADIADWFAQLESYPVTPIVSHAAYLINLGSPDPELWEKSSAAFTDELQRAEELKVAGVVLHPGGHMGEGEAAGVARVAEGLNRCHAATAGFHTLTLLECTAGQGTSLGHTFEQLHAIMSGVHQPERIAFCLDTCHLFAAGYDIRATEPYQATMDQFIRLFGAERLKCWHFNDSKKDLGSRVDRHDAIGEGLLGLEAFRNILNDPRWGQVPKILETPKSDDMHEDVENIARLRSLIA
jgi:deoxyribonuclease IV